MDLAVRGPWFRDCDIIREQVLKWRRGDIGIGKIIGFRNWIPASIITTTARWRRDNGRNTRVDEMPAVRNPNGSSRDGVVASWRRRRRRRIARPAIRWVPGTVGLRTSDRPRVSGARVGARYALRRVRDSRLARLVAG